VELNLIAQDLSAYGRDTGEYDLYKLLNKLAELDKLEWIRLLYFYPEHITDRLVEAFLSSDKIVRYLDIPIQHASDKILKSMRRNITRNDLSTILNSLKSQVPDLSIRTSVIVGYPGESEEDFKMLCDFIAEQRFDHLGCFAYSQEEGTAAAKLPDQIHQELKEERLNIVMTLQKEISRQNLQQKLGQTLPVLVEGRSQETDLLFSGRLPTQAPEVDGVVYINDGDVKPGQIQRVKITECHEYDLIGHVVDK
jgi:ribosomal protein S12 methylthiotransferase